MIARVSHFFLLRMKKHRTGEMFLFCTKKHVLNKRSRKVHVSKFCHFGPSWCISVCVRSRFEANSHCWKNPWDLFPLGNGDRIPSLLQALPQDSTCIIWGKRRHNTLNDSIYRWSITAITLFSVYTMPITCLFFRCHERIMTNVWDTGDDAEQQSFALRVAINQDDVLLRHCLGVMGSRPWPPAQSWLCMEISLGTQPVSNWMVNWIMILREHHFLH